MASRYEIFCTTINAGSFTKTAELLGYSQSAVSQVIKSLENELGTTLVKRDKSGISLTIDGANYFPFIQSIASAEASLASKKKEMDGFSNSEIRIGTFTGVSRNLLPQLIQEFKESYPDVRFTLQQGNYTSISNWIKQGTVDFGFTGEESVAGLTITPIKKDEMKAVLPVNHKLTSFPTVTMKQLSKEPLILVSEGIYNLPENTFNKLSLIPNIEYVVHDDYSVLAMIRRGLGISILYDMVLDGFDQGVELRPIEGGLERTLSVAWQNFNTMPTASRKFAEFIIKRAPLI